jgi:hypothetical protein
MPNASGDEVLPENAIFRFELIGEFPQQLFYPAEDLGRQTDGINASDSGHDRPRPADGVSSTARATARTIEDKSHFHDIEIADDPPLVPSWSERL